jgi:serine/threonine protein kinase/peptidoglycan hydrolase-like protein with peptidoglycan-binding domain
LRGVLPAGTRLRSYEIVSVLGQGSFGITYRARDTTLNRDVAIKEYLPTSLAVREGGTTVVPRSTELAEEFVWGRDRFLEEARTLATLGRAPAVVRVHDFLEANGTAYIVMELALGETLDRHLKRDGVLSPHAVERILHPLLDGLKRVHDVGFLHRDIKPANIVLDEEGNPTLIDFGAARAAMAGRTVAMTAIFTPGYAAAEQFTSANQGPWTDIYGLSATLYQAITGAAPPSAIERILDDTYEPLGKLLPPGFPPGLLAGIDAGLGVRSAVRPQSISDWRAVLSGAEGVGYQATVVLPQAARPSPARVESVGSSPAEELASRRRIGLWAAGAGAAILILAGGGYAAFVATRPPTVDAAVQSLTAEELTRALEERRKADALAEEKRKLEVEARRTAEADAEAKRKADEALLAAQQERQKAESELAKLKAEMETRRQAEETQRAQAAAAAQRAVEEAGKRNAAEAQMAALRKAEEDARLKAAADAAARQRADEEAQRKAQAEADARRQAEQDAQKKAAAEAEAKRQADDALAKAQADRQRADEDAARQTAEAAAKEKAAVEARQKAEVDANQAAEATAKQKAEADAKARAEAETAAAKKAAETTEAGLHLTQTDRQRLQIALTSLGFNTNGSDGVFGPRSRDMIAAWQKARNLPPTGFLSATQQQALLREASAAIAKYDDDQKKVEEDKKKAEEEKKIADEAKRKTDEEKAKAEAAATAVVTAPVVPPTPQAPAPGNSGVLKKEPPAGDLKEGQKILVDDGTCPTGYVMEVTGGNLVTKNVPRSRRCVSLSNGASTTSPPTSAAISTTTPSAPTTDATASAAPPHPDDDTVLEDLHVVGKYVRGAPSCKNVQLGLRIYPRKVILEYGRTFHDMPIDANGKFASQPFQSPYTGSTLKAYGVMSSRNLSMENWNGPCYWEAKF